MDDDGSPFGDFGSGGGPQNEDNFKRTIRILLYSMMVLITFVMLQKLFSPDAEPEITYNEYKRLLSSNLIESCRVEKSTDGSSVLYGELKKYERLELVDKTAKKRDQFMVRLPEFSSAMADELVEKGVRCEVEESSDGLFNLLIVFGPWLLLGVVYFFIMRRMTNQNGSARNIFNFGRSRAKMITEFDTKVTFEDVAGVEEAKEELTEIVDFLKSPEKFQRLGSKTPKGVLLLGPPGTGKTLLAKAVAGEAGVPFFSMSGADFVEMFVGVGASRVRDLFEQAKRHSPCIIFIDEIDAVGRQRGAGLGGGHDEREQTLNQLLVEMDGFGTHENIILIAATNRPDVLDSALLRPGRFDRQVVVDKPDIRGREAILKIHTKKIPLAKDVDIAVLAKSTPGFVGADLANLVNEASILASRNNHDEVTAEDFENARDKVLMGPERRSVYISEQQKEITSYHESGHVLVAKFTDGSDPVHKVTIIPRGRALGVTSYLPLEDKYTYSKQYLTAMITYALGGRAAEELIFKEISTGAGNDIQRATDLARKMVCEWGMSEKLGPINYGNSGHEVFLGRDMNRVRDFSEDTARMIDNEVRQIVTDCMNNAKQILLDNIDTLHRLAKALLEREVLNSEEIEKLIAGETLTPV
ncbi:ATP-dependent metalloprotease FtsH [Chloroherpeton thalassium ATCC 35110]|uniref:ATP-dependent zinc metalloprotease FtsH n=2 Tax=Chloroherpeton thalassium TaxID=100716 RepID=B3QRX2_CHLT3|nr:ATP-dependent metalloprotease FtsH [Chloroherpeton thalassium ATCC 35110]